MSDSVRPLRRQPTRIPRPWDSPGKNTGVGCHCLLRGTQHQPSAMCLPLSYPLYFCSNSIKFKFYFKDEESFLKDYIICLRPSSLLSKESELKLIFFRQIVISHLLPSFLHDSEYRYFVLILLLANKKGGGGIVIKEWT